MYQCQLRHSYIATNDCKTKLQVTAYYNATLIKIKHNRYSSLLSLPLLTLRTSIAIPI